MSVLSVIWFGILFGHGLVAAGAAIVLFQIWREGEYKDVLLFLFFLLLASRAIEVFIRFWALDHLEGAQLPHTYSVMQLVAATIGAIPCWLIGAYLFGMMRKRKK